MNDFDLTVYDYRAEKAKKNAEFILAERLKGHFEKIVVRTKTAGYVECSIYRPGKVRTAGPGQAALPIVFNFHGGGMVLAFYEQDGKYCQRLADNTGCAVVNVDYPVAPEFKYPKPVLASYETVLGVCERAGELGLDKSRIFACGHSAGGNIAVDLCLIDRDREAVGFLGAIVDYAPLRQTLSQKVRQAIDVPGAINTNRMAQYTKWYFDDLNRMGEPLASPVDADLHNLPAMLIISAEYDPLSQEEREFAKRAKTAGVLVRYKLYRDCQHGFTHEELAEYSPNQAKDAWQMMACFIKDLLRSSPATRS